MKVETMKVDDLVPYEKNPRDNDKAVDAVANSIKEFGFLVPVVIDKDNVIAAGHTRVKAAKKLGMKEVPVVRASDLTDEQVRAFRLADNKTGELASWDFDLLLEEVKEIPEVDLSAFGFDPGDDKEEKYQNQEEKIEDPELPKSRVIVAGLSLFGETEQEFVVEEIEEDVAAAILEKIKESGTEEIGTFLSDAVRKAAEE